MARARPTPVGVLELLAAAAILLARGLGYFQWPWPSLILALAAGFCIEQARPDVKWQRWFDEPSDASGTSVDSPATCRQDAFFLERADEHALYAKAEAKAQGLEPRPEGDENDEVLLERSKACRPHDWPLICKLYELLGADARQLGPADTRLLLKCLRLFHRCDFPLDVTIECLSYAILYARDAQQLESSAVTPAEDEAAAEPLAEPSASLARAAGRLAKTLLAPPDDGTWSLSSSEDGSAASQAEDEASSAASEEDEEEEEEEDVPVRPPVPLTLPLALGGPDGARALVLLVFLAHTYVIDETCFLATWHSYIFPRGESLDGLNSDVMRLFGSRGFRLHLSDAQVAPVRQQLVATALRSVPLE